MVIFAAWFLEPVEWALGVVSANKNKNGYSKILIKHLRQSRENLDFAYLLLDAANLI